MKEKLSAVAETFSPSPIQQLSHLAQRCNAINLAEGFPDFPAPPLLKSAAVSAINSDFNQYRHVQGICDRLAKIGKGTHGLEVDPLTDIAICCGQTEAFAAAIFSIIDPGDGVILFDPSYETYDACISMAGGVPVFLALDPPHWTLDNEKFLRSFTSRTKAVVLNSPHNPTGKAFSKDELEVIATACCTNDCLVVTDKVDCVKKLIEEAGVVGVPGCGFFHSNKQAEVGADNFYHNRYIRFAFCKSDDTLAAAAQNLREFVNRAGAFDHSESVKC